MLTTPPYRAGQDMESVEAMKEMIDAACCMATMNYLDLPAMSVPTNVRELNIPIGVQIIGPRRRYAPKLVKSQQQVLVKETYCQN
jgi:Asp-tRNA(Asn)/Glu-tRNA(Gln) amidotransferase A subunit family amidase